MTVCFLLCLLVVISLVELHVNLLLTPSHRTYFHGAYKKTASVHRKTHAATRAYPPCCLLY